MAIDELREKQVTFLKDLPAVRKKLKVLEDSRSKFVKVFSVEKLQKLPLEVYVCLI